MYRFNSNQNLISRLQQNLLLGLGGTGATSAMDISPTEALARRLTSSGTSSSAAQSPGLNLASHHPSVEDESLSPAFAASSLLDIKDVISGNNGKWWPIYGQYYSASISTDCLFCLAYLSPLQCVLHKPDIRRIRFGSVISQPQTRTRQSVSVKKGVETLSRATRGVVCVCVGNCMGGCGCQLCEQGIPPLPH